MKKSFLILIILLTMACSKEEQPAMGAISVVVSPVEEVLLKDTISVVGTLKANEQVTIKNEIDGKLEEVLVEEGQEVKAGDLLLKIQHKKLSAMVDEARANFKLAKADKKRGESLFKKKTISSQAYDRAVSKYDSTLATLKLTEQKLDDALIKAAFDGIMGSRLVSPGQFITNGTALTTLVSLDPIKVEINVPERFTSALTTGRTIKIKVAAFPEKIFTGKVYFVNPTVAESTKTLLIKAKVSNKDYLLKPGMFARVELTLTDKVKTLLVKDSALMIRKGDKSLFVVGENNLVEKRSVKTGKFLDGKVQVLSGVKADENVIIEGLQKVGPGFPVVFQNPAEKVAK